MYVQTRVRNTNVYGWKEDDFFHIWNAVRLLHQNGVAHGDIHEQNFAKNAKGLPVLIDFDHA
jgi:tRNA A-37 threonylcarbamoyl transferase component Bud32